MKGDVKKSWAELASNVDQFFASRSQGLNCHQGCSKCCEVDRSVFSLEADMIRDYLASLDPIDAQSLKSKLKNSIEGHCSFLSSGSCLIYEARPLICRSHGLVHKRSSGPHHCELNYIDGLPSEADWIDEERLSSLLSLLQHHFEKEFETPVRESLKNVAQSFLKGPHSRGPQSES